MKQTQSLAEKHNLLLLQLLKEILLNGRLSLSRTADSTEANCNIWSSGKDIHMKRALGSLQIISKTHQRQ